MDSTKKSNLPLLSLMVFIATLVVNYVANSGLIGQTQKEISDRYRNFITPEPFTFSIWGVIYLLVAIALIYQLYVWYKKNEYDPAMDKFNILFILTSICNILWNIFWVMDNMVLSSVFIFVFAILLAMMNTHFKGLSFSGMQKIYPIAFSIYAGWLTVATVTNIAALLVKSNWAMFGLPESTITIITYLVVAALAFYIIANLKNPLFNLPIIWAFIGIRATVIDNPPRETTPLMEYVIYIVIALLVIQMIYVFVKNDNNWLPDTDRRHA